MVLKSKGFTLLEVMIALALFSVFFITYLSSQSANFISSERMERNLVMHNVAENIINDLLVAPPQLSSGLTLKPQQFDYEEDERFEYTVEYKQFELPNIFNLGGNGEEDGEEGSSNPASQYVDLLFKQVTENVKEALWQIRVTVINKETNYEYWLTSWLRNPNYEIKTSLPKLGK